MFCSNNKVQDSGEKTKFCLEFWFGNQVDDNVLLAIAKSEILLRETIFWLEFWF
jgi:hypothetical protein